MKRTIYCEEVRKIFHSTSVAFEALKGITLSVHENELLMLVGPSGAGKTTLLSIMAGILSPTEGSCTVLDEDIGALAEEEKTKFRGEHIGFVFQSFNLIPTLSALENVIVPLMIDGIPEKSAETRGLEMLDLLGLADRAHELPTAFSGGQLQRLSVIRGCIRKPKIVLCDEPTSFLDHENGVRVMELMKALQQQDQTTQVIVTHDPRIFSFADRIVEIDDGIIKKEETKNSVRSAGG
ncbi:MAG: ABC transporter ATP-binding protein [Chlamydiota bacterium]